MPAAAPWIAIAVASAATAYQGIAGNQQAQHAKGAAQAQETAMNAQIKGAQDLDLAKQKQSAESAAAGASANATAASKLLARKRTLIGGSSTPDSSILSSGSDTAPTITKTLLGA